MRPRNREYASTVAMDSIHGTSMGVRSYRYTVDMLGSFLATSRMCSSITLPTPQTRREGRAPSPARVCVTYQHHNGGTQPERPES
jgi:hypothetical protein